MASILHIHRLVGILNPFGYLGLSFEAQNLGLMDFGLMVADTGVFGFRFMVSN